MALSSHENDTATSLKSSSSSSGTKLSEGKEEKKLSLQAEYDSYIQQGHKAVKNNDLNSAIIHYRKATTFAEHHKEIKKVDDDFIAAIATIDHSNNELKNLLESEDQIFVSFLSKLHKSSAKIKDAETLLLYYAKYGTLEQQIFIAYLLQNNPTNQAECEKKLYEHRFFMQGLRELNGLDGCPINEGKAIVNFEKSALQATEHKQTEHAAHSRLAIAICHRRLANKAKLKEKNPEERITRAMQAHKDLLTEYKHISLVTRKRIFLNIFKLLATATHKITIIGLLLDNIQTELNESQPSEILLRQIFQSLLETPCLLEMPIWKLLISKINHWHKKKTATNLRNLFIEELNKLKSLELAKDPAHQYYIERALGDCYARIPTRDSLKISLTHYDEAKRNLTTAKIADEKFSEKSYSHVYKMLGEAATELREETKEVVAKEELRLEAIRAFETAANLGEVGSSLEAASLIELDGDKTDIAISKYELTMQHAITANDAKQIVRTIQQILKFKATNDLETVQIDTLERLLENAFIKLNDPVFVRRFPIESSNIYEKAKIYVPDIRCRSAENTSDQYKAYRDYVNSKVKYYEYQRQDKIEALKKAANADYPPAIVDLLLRNETRRGWFHAKRIDRPLYLSAKMLLTISPEEKETIAKAREHLDEWATQELEEKSEISSRNQRIKIARFYKQIIEECKTHGLPSNPDAYILQKAVIAFKNLEDKPLLTRIETSMRKAYGKNSSWIKTKRAETTTGISIAYSQAESLTVPAKPTAQIAGTQAVAMPVPSAPAATLLTDVTFAPVVFDQSVDVPVPVITSESSSSRIASSARTTTADLMTSLISEGGVAAKNIGLASATDSIPLVTVEPASQVVLAPPPKPVPVTQQQSDDPLVAPPPVVRSTPAKRKVVVLA